MKMPDPKKKDDNKDGDKDDLDLSKNPAIIAINKTLTGLGMLMTAQQTASAKTNQGLDTLVEQIKAGKLGGDKPDDDDKKVDPDAINELENDQLVKIVLSEVGKMMDDKLGGVRKELDNTNKGIMSRDVETEFRSLLVTNPDLIEWTGEMKTISDKTPGLSINQLYTLARSGDETKSAEMDEKHKVESDDDKETTPGLIGFMPTSGPTAEGDEKLTRAEESEQAWQETLDAFPEIAQLGEG